MPTVRPRFPLEKKSILFSSVGTRRAGRIPFAIICLSLLQLTYANKRYRPAPCNLGEYPIPFIYGLEIGLDLSKLYKVR